MNIEINTHSTMSERVAQIRAQWHALPELWRMHNVTLGHRQFYNVAQPYTNGRCIVYGDSEMGWYDYVLIDSEGLTETRSNLQYGSAQIALRDALIKASEG